MEKTAPISLRVSEASARRSFVVFLLLLFCPVLSKASGLTYHGRIFRSDATTPVTASAVTFKVQIRSLGPEDCLFFEETHVKNLSQSNGVFALGINDGTASLANTEAFPLERVFQNRGTFHFPVGKCFSGTSYTPVGSVGRKISVEFNDGTFAGWEPLPDQTIGFVPTAIDSLSVGGFGADQMLRVVDGAGEPLSVSALTSAQHGTLLDLIAGTSATFLTASSSLAGGNLVNGSVTDNKLATGISGAKITGNIGGLAGGFTGSLTGDVSGTQSATLVTRLQGRALSAGAPADGQVLKWNGTTNLWEPSPDLNSGGGGGGGVTEVTGTGAISVINTTTTPVVSVRDGTNAVSGVLQLALSGQSDPGKAVAADDSRLSDARAPLPHTHPADEIGSASGVYFTYRPDGTACANDEVLKWKTADQRWECGPDLAGTSFGSQTARQVFAAPTGSSGAPSFRHLTIADLQSANSGPFLLASGACATGTQLTYQSPADTLSCAAFALTSGQVTTALGFTPADAAGLSTTYVAKTGDTMTGALNLPANGLVVGASQLVVAGGLVGIGSATPTEKLDVAGKVKATEFCLGGSCLAAWPSGGVTSILTGTGLTGGPISTSGTISIAAGGVSATELASGAVTTAHILDNNVTPAKLETVSGLTAAAYGSATQIPTITVDNKGRVTAVSLNTVNGLPSGASGQYLKSNGSVWAGANITFSDIKNGVGTSAFNLAGCQANQTVSWSSLLDMFTCQDIGSLDATKITTGTLDAARLPAISKIWEDAGSGKIRYSGGNVGIGTIVPSSKLEVDGGLRVADGSAASPSLSFSNAPSTGFYNLAGNTIYANGGVSKFGMDGAAVYAVGAGVWRLSFTNTAAAPAIGVATDTGLFAPASSTLGLSAGGNERMRIDSSGNVGIGTTNPQSRLDVSGIIRATEICDEAGLNCKDISAGWGSGASSVSGDVSGAFGATTVDAIKGKSVVPAAYASGQVLSYDGTNWVNALVQLSSVTGTLPIANGGTGATTQSGAINALLPAQTSQANKILQTDGTNVSWVNTPTTGMTALTGDVTASGTGSVATTIATGAVTSAKILDATIVGTDMNFTGVNTATSSLTMKDATGKFSNFACSTTGHVPAWTASGFACQAPTVTETDPKVGANTLNMLSKWNGSALVASSVYESGGNVGIGTSSPAYNLDVNGTSQSQYFRASVAGSAISPVFVNGNGSNGLYFPIAGGISLVTGNTDRLRIDSSGNVGIGSATPAQKLDVVGNIAASGNMVSAGRMVSGVSTSASALSSVTASFATANTFRSTAAAAACGTLNFTNTVAGGNYTVTLVSATATCTTIQWNGLTTNVKLPTGYTGGEAAAGVVYTAVDDGSILWVSYVPF